MDRAQRRRGVEVRRGSRARGTAGSGRTRRWRRWWPATGERLRPLADRVLGRTASPLGAADGLGRLAAEAPARLRRHRPRLRRRGQLPRPARRRSDHLRRAVRHAGVRPPAGPDEPARQRDPRDPRRRRRPGPVHGGLRPDATPTSRPGGRTQARSELHLLGRRERAAGGHGPVRRPSRGRRGAGASWDRRSRRWPATSTACPSRSGPASCAPRGRSRWSATS